MKPPPQPLLIPVASPGGGPLYRVVRQWRYQWLTTDPTHPPQRLTVHSGFESDGASIPRLLWTLTGITPDGLHRAAALAHDFLYRYAGHLPASAHQALIAGTWRDTAHPWSRLEADRLFARLLRECGVGPWRRRLMYLGVRLGGWTAWHEQKRHPHPQTPPPSLLPRG